MSKSPLIGIIMGSDSDYPTMKEAAEVCEQFAIPYEIKVVSAHRTPQDMFKYGQDAHLRGLKVIIAGAGGAAHLPGMIAASTPIAGNRCTHSIKSTQWYGFTFIYCSNA